MADTRITDRMGRHQPKPGGFPGLRCCQCGAKDSLFVRLGDARIVGCRECDNDQHIDQIEANCRLWLRCIEWLKSCPAQEDPT